MASTQNSQTGLFWTPRGGNNAKAIWASCHTFSSVTENKETGKIEKSTILVDMGQNEMPQDFHGGKYEKVVPVLDDCLSVPGCKTPENEAQAIFLTHCHSDHIAGIFEYLKMGAKLPPVYGSEYTIKALRKELMDNGIKRDQWPELKPIKAGEVVQIGNMQVEAFTASHSIPGCFSFKISNDEASIFHSGDTKADETSFLGNGVDMSAYDRIGSVDLMTFDATATNKLGHATYEAEIFEAYKELFEENPDRQIIAVLPAAHMERLASVISAAQAVGKDVLIDGGASMESNVMALELGGFNLQEKCPDIQVVSSKSGMDALMDHDRSVTITTGIYGEPNSPFIQKLIGANDRFAIRDNAVIITPSTGGGAERLNDLLEIYAPDGVSFITANERNIYGSGHAQADDFVKIAGHIHPKTVSPIHCTRVMAENFNQLASQNGYQTLPDYPHNGCTVQVDKTGCRVISEKEPAWFGLNHEKQADGSVKTSVARLNDDGSRMEKDAAAMDRASQSKKAEKIEERQAIASEKIADYRRKETAKKMVGAELKRRRSNEY